MLETALTEMDDEFDYCDDRISICRFAELDNGASFLRTDQLLEELIPRIKDQRVHTGNGCRRLIMEFGALSFPQNYLCKNFIGQSLDWITESKFLKSFASGRRHKV